jgi:deoxyribonuclease V
MHIRPLHSWNLTPAQAIALQKELAGRIDETPPRPKCELLAGADVSYKRFATTFYAGVVVLRTSDWTVVERQEAVAECRFPYIPGLLSFRELPVLLEAFAKLKCRPDAILFDGNGTAHPRRIGIAAHLGLWLQVPTVGCAKSRLCGEPEEPGNEPGNQARLLHKGAVIGSVLRTKRNTKPLFISTGNLIDLATSVRLVLESCRGYRLPEPTRQAHLFVNEVRRQAQASAVRG